MRPVLFSIGGLVFHAYPAMLALAFLVCTLLAVRDAERRDPPLAITPFAGIAALVGALFGARMFFVLQYESWRELWRAVQLLGPGLVFYGGLIGGLTALVVYLRFKRVPVLPALGVLAPYLALGEAITRIGCFLNGCCYGAPTACRHGVVYGAQSLAFEEQVRQGLLTDAAAQALPVHPTQLYMTLGLAAVFVILRWGLSRVNAPSAPAAGYLALYGALRFGVEVFRGDSARSVFGMTVSQAISVILAAGGLIWLVGAVYESKRASRATPEG